VGIVLKGIVARRLLGGPGVFRSGVLSERILAMGKLRRKTYLRRLGRIERGAKAG
jgi:hypothetical protein